MANGDDSQSNPESGMFPTISPVMNANADIPNQPDMGTPMPNLGGNPPQPVRPGGRPSFFKGLITALGTALAQGTQAGLEAPRTAQGPTVAAQIASQIPQRQFEQKVANQKALTSQQMDKLTLAMTQLKLHQLQTMVLQEDDNVQNAAFLHAREDLEQFVKAKAPIDILSTGNQKDIHDEFAKRNADARANGQEAPPLLIMPAPGADPKNPTFALVQWDKGQLKEEIPAETLGASDLGISQEDFDAAGLTKFRVEATPSGMDAKKAYAQRLQMKFNWWTKAMNQYGKWQTTKANIGSREKEGKANRDMRLKIAELNANSRQVLAREKTLNDQTDKEIISAGKTLISANKALGDAQGKIGNKAWDTLGGGETREIATKRRARDQAEKNYNELLAKKGTAQAIRDTEQVKPGSTADWQTAQNFKLRFKDGKTAVAEMKKRGYAFLTDQKGNKVPLN